MHPRRPNRRPLRSIRGAPASFPGLILDRRFVDAGHRAHLLEWLESLYPLWEDRYSEGNPPPPGRAHRQLLRPVYWLGNWQFACLDYYRPPNGVRDRCVRAEPFPPALAELVAQIEALVRDEFRAEDVPAGWHLNTCLVNFYGSRVDGRTRTDVARVGEHKDFEPGPVASISFGDRALFQFVRSHRPGEREDVVVQQWLEDGSLQVFGGRRWKEQLFHRVQRVEDSGRHRFALHVEGFETRRINLTLRYVPDPHVVPYADLAPGARRDVRRYVEELARHSPFFARELARARPA